MRVREGESVKVKREERESEMRNDDG